MKTLKTRLKDGVQASYLITGEDIYLYDKAIAMIKKAAGLQLEEFNFNIFDDDNFSAKAVVEGAMVLPMSGDKRVILIKNLTKVTESDKKALEKYIASPEASTVLIISDYYGKFGSLKGTEQVSCKRFDKKLSAALVVKELTRQGKQISEDATDLLIEYCSGYLTRVMSECEKLVFYSKDPLITKDMIEELVTKDSEFSIFELGEALGRKDSDRAIQLLSAMERDSGTFSLITNYFRRLFFISIGGSDNQNLASLLGVKEYAITKSRAALQYYSAMQLKTIFALLEEIDFGIKSGKYNAINGLYLLAFKILNI